MQNKKNSTTINEEEVKKFSKIADEWWNPNGKFKPLHKFNPIRIKYIRNFLISHLKLDKNSPKILKDLKIADIGCGGGLLSEPMASLGANVTGIDASEKNINIAKAHLKKSNLKINYLSSDIEEFSKNNENQFDIVLNMEVIEHVDNVEDFIKYSSKILKKDGIIFIATLNRNIKSFLSAIVAAEYILNWLPRGTHDWRKFLKPHQIYDICNKNELNLLESKGFKYNILDDRWKLTNNLDVNYIMIYSHS